MSSTADNHVLLFLATYDTTGASISEANTEVSRKSSHVSLTFY
jgi:hypothetical protein